LGFKISKRVPITFWVVGVTSWNFTRWCGSRPGW